MNATVTRWFDHRGYGFAMTDSGKEVFIHYKEVTFTDTTGRVTLFPGQRVQIDLYDNGKLEGRNVRKC